MPSVFGDTVFRPLRASRPPLCLASSVATSTGRVRRLLRISRPLLFASSLACLTVGVFMALVSPGRLSEPGVFFWLLLLNWAKEDRCNGQIIKGQTSIKFPQKVTKERGIVDASPSKIYYLLPNGLVKSCPPKMFGRL